MYGGKREPKKHVNKFNKHYSLFYSKEGVTQGPALRRLCNHCSSKTEPINIYQVKSIQYIDVD